MDFDIKDAQKFIGKVTYDHLKDVDAFIGEELALFIPSTGPCKYATSKDHSHPAYSFILTFDNYCKVVIDDKEIVSEPGMFYAFPPEVLHHEKLTEKFTRYVAILIDKSFFETQANEYPDYENKTYKSKGFSASNELRNYIKDFIIEYKNKFPGHKNILNAISLNITHAIIRTLLNYNSQKQEIASRIEINNTIEYMHLHYNEKLSVDDLSKYICLSSSHFSRIFKKETGKSPLDYLIHIRLDKAKKMLLTGEKNLAEIAMDTGFNSSSHFTSSFTKHFKITPSEFKKAI